MDFRQLEAFCAIIEWGSFSEAAKKLYITQPTISNHMRMLENELNTSLISRTTKTMTVTPDGRRFYKYARSMLDMRNKAMSDFSRSGSRRIHMGASSVPSAFILPQIMSEYKQLHSDAYFEIIQSDSLGIIANLQSGIIDAALSGTPCQDEGFDCIPAFRDEMVLVTPDNDHYRAMRDAARMLRACDDSGYSSENCAVEDLEYDYDITELLLQPFILRNDGSASRREVLNYLSSIGMSESQLNITSQMNDLKSVIASITCGLGVSILSRSVTKTLPHGSVLTFPLSHSGEDTVYRTYYLICRKNLTGGYIKDFIEFIMKYAEKQ